MTESWLSDIFSIKKEDKSIYLPSKKGNKNNTRSLIPNLHIVDHTNTDPYYDSTITNIL